MAGVSDYSTNPDDNTSINGIDIGENCDAGNLNNALRQFAADLRSFYDTYIAVTFPISIPEGGTGQTSAAAALVALGGLDAAYRRLPQSIKTGAFAFDATHDGGHVYYTGAAAAATIPTNATVAFAAGTVIVVVNNGSGALTLTRSGGVAMKWANTGADANRTLAIGGVATLIKTNTDEWFVTGAGLS